ncbi:MAG TPA: DUF2075 domain-containing protein, partial [Clostridia bacterium]|nr:DUF2075 domain-containing protein [Clostridia bacterium]HUM61812.1 DUF2075 domain-containing protein [Clostridia bacterium]
SYLRQHCLFALILYKVRRGLVFPDASFTEAISMPDFSREQVADKTDLLDFKAYIERLARFWRSRHSQNLKVFPPDKRQIDQALSILRPKFDAKVSLPAYIRNFDREAITLTENQQDTFNGLLENERCLIRGSAGTGKTILALNFVAALAEEGRSFAFFCYNLRLAEYLKDRVQAQKPSVCDSFTEYMEEVAGAIFPEQCKKVKKENINRFYSSQLPELFMEAFLESGQEAVDVLIVDEAQDLLTPGYLDALDLMLKGGLKNGRWRMFLDAELQNLYQSSLNYDDIQSMIKEISPYYTRYPLKDNCRNTPAIIQYVDEVFGLQTVYRNREELGPDVSEQFYKNRKDLLSKVNKQISCLLEEGLLPSQLTILSPYRFEQSVAQEISACKVSQEAKKKDSALFSTIASYKGLESQVIMLIEMDRLGWEVNQRLLYVGATRAKSALYVYVSEQSKTEMSYIKGNG